MKFSTLFIAIAVCTAAWFPTILAEKHKTKSTKKSKHKVGNVEGISGNDDDTIAVDDSCPLHKPIDTVSIIIAPNSNNNNNNSNNAICSYIISII